MKFKFLDELELEREVKEKITAGFDSVLKDIESESDALTRKINEDAKELEGLKKALEEKDGQIASLTAEVEGKNTEIGGLKGNIEELEGSLRGVKIDSAIELALTKAGARNIKACRALLNMENISLEEDKVTGLDDEINALKGAEATSFLFSETGSSTNGFVPGAGSAEPKADTKNMNYTELCAYLEKNPGAQI